MARLNKTQLLRLAADHDLEFTDDNTCAEIQEALVIKGVELVIPIDPKDEQAETTMPPASAPKPSTAPTAADKVAMSLRLVQCFLMKRSRFNVTPRAMMRVFFDLGMKKGRCTWYQVEKSHVMPRAHCELFIHAGLVSKSSVTLVPKDSDLKPSGIVQRNGIPAPKAEFEEDVFANLDDLDELEELD